MIKEKQMQKIKRNHASQAVFQRKISKIKDEKELEKQKKIQVIFFNLFVI